MPGDLPRSDLTDVPADPAEADLLQALISFGREFDGERGSGAGPVQVLGASTEALVCRVGSVVVKAHRLGTDSAALTVRLAVAARACLDTVLLAPLTPVPRSIAGRWVTAWPFGGTVVTDPDTAPWAASARLLAGLHTTSVGALPTPVPPAGGPWLVRRSVAALDSLGRDRDADSVRAAWLALPPWARAERRPPGSLRLCHGDWHFGQLVTGADGDWRLCDVDDLGFGDPLWDLGRPAAYRAIDVVPAPVFEEFLAEYRAAGGFLPAGVEAWPALDVVARAYAVQTAARTLVRARRSGQPLDDVARELLAACRRMPAARL